jgi:hypothetical protein
MLRFLILQFQHSSRVMFKAEKRQVSNAIIIIIIFKAYKLVILELALPWLVQPTSAACTSETFHRIFFQPFLPCYERSSFAIKPSYLVY